MKNSILLFSFTICSLLFGISHAQWQPDVRLTNDTAASSTSYNNAWCIASSGNTVHVVWHDARNGVNNYEIYYKRSTDGGISWGTDTRLTNNSSLSEQPSVSVSGSVVHVVWTDSRTGFGDLYYKRSPDGGVSWGADTQLSNLPTTSRQQSVAVSGSVVHVVWVEFNAGGYFDLLYYKRSINGGTSWGTDILLTNQNTIFPHPSIAVSGTIVHVVWYENRDGNREIYYKRSPDGGVSWGADTRLTNNSAASRYPSVSVSGQVVHVVWEDERDVDTEIYYKRSTDGGVSWGTDTRLTNNTAGSWGPSVTVSGSVVHVVWRDYRNGNNEIYYKRSTNAGVSWETDTRLTANIFVSRYPSVAVSDQVVHVVWTDGRNLNDEIYYKRNPTGNPVGIHNISNEIPNGFSLEQNYPNPFNPVTNINFSIPKAGIVKLVIYDVLGKQVAELVNGQYNAGSYKVDFNASSLSSGVYFYKIEAEGFTDIKKMMLVK